MIQVGLEMQFPLSKETAAMQCELQAKIEAHNAACARVAREEAELKSTPDEDFTAAHTLEAGKIRGRKTDLRGDEISIRQDGIEPYFDRIEKVDHPAAVNASFAEFEAAKVAVREALVSIGYTVAKIDWHILVHHGRISAAVDARDAIHGKRPWHDARQENLKALDKAKAELAELKRRAVALVA